MRLSTLAISAVLVFGCAIAPRAAEFSAHIDANAQQIQALSPAIAGSLLNFQPTEDDAEDFDEYFYFQKNGVLYQNALADICLCNSYTANLAPTSLVPKFMPFGADRGRVTGRYNTEWWQWGLVGQFVISSLASDMSLVNWRNCMRNLGYRRYGISRDIWKQIYAGTGQEIEMRLAAIASGPQPHRQAIEP